MEIGELTKSLTRDSAFYLGKSVNGWHWSKPEDAILVLGPPRSGKTSSIIVPTLLLANGPIVATSTKTEIIELTWQKRAKSGKCVVFDPTGTVTTPRMVDSISWSPIDCSTTWDGALLMARSMSKATTWATSSTDSFHWQERAESLLGPLFHAAALEEMGMGQLLSWVNRRNASDALRVLESNNSQVAADLLYGILSTDDRELSGIWSTSSSLLTAYRSEGALQSAATSGQRLNLAEYAKSSDTIYIPAPARFQNLVAPIIVGFLENIKTERFQGNLSNEKLPQMLFALDEVANIAPLPDLPSLVSEGGGQGITVLACLQDLSQARVRWGQASDGFLTLFGTKVIFPGIADMTTLNAIAALAGNRHEVRETISNPRWWDALRRTRNDSYALESVPQLPPDKIYTGEANRALLIESGRSPCHLEVTPYFSCEPFKSLCGELKPGLTRKLAEQTPFLDR